MHCIGKRLVLKKVKFYFFEIKLLIKQKITLLKTKAISHIKNYFDKSNDARRIYQWLIAILI